MKNILSHRLTWVKIVESVLLILLGILVAVLGGVYHDQMPRALTICLSVFLLADGLITLLSFWLEAKKNFTVSLMIGAILLTAGALLANYAADGRELAYDIALFISIFIIVIGGIFLVKAIIQTAYKGPIGWIIIHYCIAAGAIALGVCSLVYTSEALKIVLVVLGIAIAVLGSVELIFSIINYRKAAKAHKADAQTKKKEAEKPQKVKVDVELNEDDKVVMKDKKNSKKKKAIKEKKAKQIEDKTKQIELKDEVKKDKKDDVKDDKKDDEPIVAEVVDPQE